MLIRQSTDSHSRKLLARDETYQNEEQFAENIRILKSKQKDLIAEAARIPLPSQGDDEQSFHGFNTVFDEIEAIKSLIENNKRTHDAKVWKIEKKVCNSSINIKKIEETIDELKPENFTLDKKVFESLILAKTNTAKEIKLKKLRKNII